MPTRTHLSATHPHPHLVNARRATRLLEREGKQTTEEGREFLSLVCDAAGQDGRTNGRIGF